MGKFVVQEERAASCPAPRSRSEMSTEATGDGRPEAVDATEPAAGAAAAEPAVDQSGERDGSGEAGEGDGSGEPGEPDDDYGEYADESAPESIVDDESLEYDEALEYD